MISERGAVLCTGAFLCSCLLACGHQDSTRPLVLRSDSVGVQIVEALRPLWGDSSPWNVGSVPLVDLVQTGVGEAHEFYRVLDMKRLPDGSLVVAERGSQTIRLFSDNGVLRHSVGGRGDGPGEFVNIRTLERADDALFVLDRGGRVTVLGPELQLIRIFNLPVSTIDIHYLSDGSLAVESFSPIAHEPTNNVTRDPGSLLRFDLNGVLVDSIGETAGRETVERIIDGEWMSGSPLFGKQSQAVSHGGRILLGAATTMQVEELSPAGDIARRFRIPDYPLHLTRSQVRAERKARLNVDLPLGVEDLPPRIRQFEEELSAPATRPAYANILVDPSGAIWLLRYRGRSEENQPEVWLIMDSLGTWLGSVAFPRGFSLMDVHIDVVLGVLTDDSDVEHPQVLRLNRAGGTEW